MDATKSAATYLTELRNTGRYGARIPEPSRPATIEDALKIQDRTIRVFGDAVGGYKCSVPTAARAVIMAPIFAPTIGSKVPCEVRAFTPSFADTARIEPEVAFVLGKSLPPRDKPYDEAEVRAAIGETRLVLELIGSRYVDPTQVPFEELLADCISNQGLFVGPLVAGGPDAELGGFKVEVSGKTADPAFAFEKEGRHPDGHPLKPLTWLANFLAKRGDGLHAGQIVTTGSYAGMIDVPLATPLTVRYGDLGEIAVEFRRKED